MNRSFLRILCKIALVYVMENRIINKGVFLHLGVIWCEVMNHIKHLEKERTDDVPLFLYGQERQ